MGWNIFGKIKDIGKKVLQGIGKVAKFVKPMIEPLLPMAEQALNGFIPGAGTVARKGFDMLTSGSKTPELKVKGDPFATLRRKTRLEPELIDDYDT
jgi:hypothetical protein